MKKISINGYSNLVLKGLDWFKIFSNIIKSKYFNNDNKQKDILNNYIHQLINIYNYLSVIHKDYGIEDMCEQILNLLFNLNCTTYNEKYFWSDYDKLKDEEYSLLDYLLMHVPREREIYQKYMLLETSHQLIHKSFQNAIRYDFPVINISGINEHIIDRSALLTNLLKYAVIKPALNNMG